MTHSFDADTALEPAGDGRRRARVPEHWFVENGPNGGFLAALATRALMESAGGDGREPRSLTLHFLAPPEAGEVVLDVDVEREGRSTTFVSLRLRQADRTVALGLGACAVWREGQPEWNELERPDVPAAHELAPLPNRDSMPRFFGNYETRPVDGLHAWMRTAEPRAVDPVLLAGLTDAWMPSAFLRMPEPTFVPTIDLTIHWRAPAGAAAGEHPWVLGAFATRLGAGGTWEEDGELWSEDGRLLAQSRQLAIVRRARW